MCEWKHSKVLCEGAESTVQGENLHIATGGGIKMWTRFTVETNFKYCLGWCRREGTHRAIPNPCWGSGRAKDRLHLGSCTCQLRAGGWCWDQREDKNHNKPYPNKLWKSSACPPAQSRANYEFKRCCLGLWPADSQVSPRMDLLLWEACSRVWPLHWENVSCSIK